MEQRPASTADIAVGRQPRRGRLVNFLLVVGTVALLLVGGEIAARAAGYGGEEIYNPDPELGWVLKPNQRAVTKVSHFPVHVNEQGYRDDPFEVPKPPGTVRIFALGASSTFGWGVRQDEVYMQVLERMLNDTARARGLKTRYEVVNAGVNAYNMRQAYYSARRIVQRYQPDGLLVAYTFNEFWNHFGTLTPQQLQGVLTGTRVKSVLRRSALWTWLVEVQARWLYNRMRRVAQGQPAVAFSGSDDSAAVRIAQFQFRATLDSIVKLARESHQALAFVVLVSKGTGQLDGPDSGQGGSWSRELAMKQVAAQAHIPVVDLLPVFGVAGADSLYVHDDPIHPSRTGHELIARLLYARLCAAAEASAPGDPEAVYRAGCSVGRGASVAASLSSRD
jgi:lysophospholipase L1-like esterase